MFRQLSVLRDGLRSWKEKQKEHHGAVGEKLASIASTVLLVFAIAVFLFVVTQVSAKGYVNLGGRSLFRVVTGSMEPTIPRGALLISRQTPIGELAENDIICYRSNQGTTNGWIITHRIVAVRTGPAGERVLETRGDANSVSDAQNVREEDLIGKVVWYTSRENGFSVFLSFLTSGFGFLSLIAVPGFLIGGLMLVHSIRSVRSELHGLSEALAKEQEDKRQAVQTGLSAEEIEQLRQEILQELMAQREELMKELLQALREEKN